jgi:Uma2 family endonuclease
MASSTSTKIWTYEDLFALPDDGKRYEIIHGELYEMPSPNFSHGTGIVNLIAILLPIVKSLGGILRTAPMDVFIKNGNPVQPDILVLLSDRLRLISSRGIEGASNLLIEILSPSNSMHDRILKRELYAHAGVLEYWLISTEAALVEVLTLDGEEYRMHVRAGGDELVTSPLLPELSFPASAVFAL